ncbi:MAG: cell division protein SepF [Acidimicrobiales bacterium]|jgi:cell division inhibitor SepF
MASFVQRALMYLGLKDIEDEDEYDAEDEEVTETPPGRVRQSSYPEPAPPRASVATVRPIARDDGREPTTPVARGAVVRPFVTQRHTKPQVVAPARFSDAQEIGDMVKASSPVIVNLQASEKDLARRMIDFCSGLTYAVGGSMEKVAESVFLLTPSNVEVSPEERQRIQENGLFRS